MTRANGDRETEGEPASGGRRVVRPIPRLMLVADGFASGRVELAAPAICDRVVEAVHAGVPWVSLRDHDADPAAFAQAASELAGRIRAARPEVAVSVHARLEVARALGAGLHVGRRGATLEEALAADLEGPVGVSAHSATTALRAARGGADYVTFSPVFETRTHPEAVPAGIDPLRLAADRAGIPVLALGGLTPPRARIARLVGAHGAAVISALLFAWDIPRTVGQFLDGLGASAPTDRA